MFERIWLNITRHKAKSLLTIVISLLITMFLLLYLAGLMSNMIEYKNLPQTLPVEGVVTNIPGKWSNDIRISASKVEKLEKTGLIKDVKKSTLLYFDHEERKLNPDEASWIDMRTQLAGVNTPEAVPEFKEAVYMEGYNSDVFLTDEQVCIVDEMYMEEMGLKLGEVYNITGYYKHYDDGKYIYEVRYVGELSAEIVGSFNINLTSVSGMQSQVIMPIRYVREVYRENEPLREDKLFYSVHSMSFTIENPLEINNFKEKVREIGFVRRNPTSTAFDHDGKALVVYDETFIKTSEQLQKNISMMQVFAPIIFAIVAFIGFLVSYLLMHSRQNEFAIMRSLGTKKASVFVTLLAESFVLSFIGALVGVLIGILILNIAVYIAFIILAVFVLLYMLGTLAALILLNRFSVMEILTKREVD